MAFINGKHDYKDLDMDEVLALLKKDAKYLESDYNEKYAFIPDPTLPGPKANGPKTKPNTQFLRHLITNTTGHNVRLLEKEKSMAEKKIEEIERLARTLISDPPRSEAEGEQTGKTGATLDTVENPHTTRKQGSLEEHHGISRSRRRDSSRSKSPTHSREQSSCDELRSMRKETRHRTHHVHSRERDRKLNDKTHIKERHEDRHHREKSKERRRVRDRSHDRSSRYQRSDTSFEKSHSRRRHRSHESRDMDHTEKGRRCSRREDRHHKSSNSHRERASDDRRRDRSTGKSGTSEKRSHREEPKDSDSSRSRHSLKRHDLDRDERPSRERRDDRCLKENKLFRDIGVKTNRQKSEETDPPSAHKFDISRKDPAIVTKGKTQVISQITLLVSANSYRPGVKLTGTA